MVTLNVYAAGLVALYAAGLYHAVQAAEAAGTLTLACDGMKTTQPSEWKETGNQRFLDAQGKPVAPIFSLNVGRYPEPETAQEVVGSPRDGGERGQDL